jgi:nitroreductase
VRPIEATQTRRMNPADLRTVIECAELAPSVHNTQPWTWHVGENTIEVRADRSRGLAVLDPHGRELTISCGAAIEFALTAVRGLGWDCDVVLLPDADDADLLAMLTIGAPRAAAADERERFEAIPRRYTDRGSYESAALSKGLSDDLSRGVNDRGAWLRVIDRDSDRLAVIQALADAEETEAADPAYREELAAWLRPNRAPDGIPATSLASVTESGRVSDVPQRDFTGENRHPHPGGETPPEVERDELLMIGTAADNAVAWLHAGRALGWVLLSLTVAGLSSQPLGQVLDVEASRIRLAKEIGLLGQVQFLLRTGRGHGAPTTGRRHASVV